MRDLTRSRRNRTRPSYNIRGPEESLPTPSMLSQIERKILLVRLDVREIKF